MHQVPRQQFHWLILLCMLCSCSSYREFEQLSQDVEIPTKIFRATYADTWSAVIKVIEQSNLDTEAPNQEIGTVKTRWNDNTIQLNFADSFGKNETVKEAKFKLIFNVIKGFRDSREVTKVTIYKRQIINQDFLQGWKIVPSDRIQEKTLLYRIGQVLMIDKRIKQLEDAKQKLEEEAIEI